MSRTNYSLIKYRPEIDGLRAIAVIPVILFHAGFSAFSGGYIGVDIFFVISGYLITSIISKALDRNDFSFLNFYYSRAKRILPALLFVLFITIPTSIWLMMPNDLARLGDSIIYTLVFLANFYFKNSADYFAPTSNQLPLLHTWSLAIEEQYYFFFPLLISLIWKYGRKIVFTTVGVIFITSFLLSILGSRNFPVSNYYMLPTRSWELLAGALIAVNFTPHFLEKFTSNPFINNYGALFGLLLIAYSVFAFDSFTPYPGYITLLPVLGTILIILFSTGKRLINSTLSSPPLVFLGGMSYSLYLWHFPIFAFSKIYQEQHGTTISTGLLFCFLIGTSYFSHHLIENPIRHSASSKLKISILLLLASLLLIASGWLLKNKTDLFKKYNSNQLQFMEIVNHDVGIQTWDRCSTASYSDSCVGGAIHAVKKIILFGDSHSYTLFHALSERLKEQEKKLILITDGNCPPVLVSNNSFQDDKCIARSREFYKAIFNDRDVDTIILAARWSWYIHREPFNNLQGGVGENSSNFLASYEKGGASRVRLMRSLFDETFQSLTAADVKTVVVDTIPEPGWNVQKKMLYRLNDLALDQVTLSYDTDLFVQRNADFDAELSKFQDFPRFKVVHPSALFCNRAIPHQCTSLMNGASLYMDDNHLSYLGSKLVSNQIIETLKSF